MNGLMRYFKIYVHLQKLKVMRDMTYRADFIAINFLNVVYALFRWFGFQFIFDETPIIGGYTFEQLMVYLAITQVIWFTSQTFVRKGVQFLIASVNEGKFDFYLTKPINPLFLALGSGARILDGFPLLGFFCLFFWTSRNAGYSLERILWSVPFVIIGSILFSLMVLFAGLLSFHFGQVGMLQALFPNITEFMKMPMSFFPQIAIVTLTFIFPLALTAEPAVRVLEGRGLGALGIAIPIMLIFWSVLNVWVYKSGLKRYASAGG